MANSFDPLTDDDYLTMLHVRTNVLLSFGMHVCYFYALQDGKRVSLNASHVPDRTSAVMLHNVTAQFLAKQHYQLHTLLYVPGDRRARGQQLTLSAELIKFKRRTP